MADRTNDRDRDKVRPPIRPKPEDPKPTLHVTGTKKNVSVTVQVPGKPPADALVTFSAGPKDDAYRKQVKKDGVLCSVKFDSDCVARGVLDMSAGSSDSTHMAAWYNGKYSTPVAIPQDPKPQICNVIKAEVVLGRAGHRNTFKIETLAEGGQNPAKLSAEVEIESTDEIIVEVDATEQRGKVVKISTDATGSKVVKIVFVAPIHSGHVNIYPSLNRSVCANVFVRHPATASRY